MPRPSVISLSLVLRFKKDKAKEQLDEDPQSFSQQEKASRGPTLG
jgi:hypothetical protein